MNELIVISGPTASGKTSTSIKLASYIEKNENRRVAIINFDSLLFYREISIGTAKPTIEEREGIEHYLIDIISINSPLNASDFIKMAKDKIELLMSENKIVILVGGSAFYLRALLKGMYDSASPNQELKDELEKIYQNTGIEYFINFLKVNDPDVLTYLHSNDHYRLIRAVTHFKSTGTKISEQKKQLDLKDPYDFTKIEHPWRLVNFYLDISKEEHQRIILARTKKMFKDGLKDEIESLLKNGFEKDLKPLQSIGYKETIELIEGRFKSESECIERIAISTRQLAKSQRTFFKKITPKIHINPITDLSQIFEATLDFIKSND